MPLQTETITFYAIGSRLWMCDADAKVKEVVVKDVNVRLTGTAPEITHSVELADGPEPFDPMWSYPSRRQLHEAREAAEAEREERLRKRRESHERSQEND